MKYKNGIIISSLSVSAGVLVQSYLLTRPDSYGNVFYVISLLILFGPPAYLVAKNFWRTSLAYLFVANFLRFHFHIRIHGFLPGVDSFKDFGLFLSVLEHNELITPYPGKLVFLQAFRIPFAEPVLAWLTALLITATLIPVVSFFTVSEMFDNKIAGVAAFVFSQDFVYLLFSKSLLKENIPILIFLVIIGILFRSSRERPWRRESLVIFVMISSAALTHYTSSYIWMIIVITIAIAKLGSGIIIQASGEETNLRNTNQIMSIFHRDRLVLSVVLFSGVVTLVWGLFPGVNLFERHLQIGISLPIELLFDRSLVQPIASRDEFGEFVGQGTLWLVIYQWIYRFAMLGGFLIAIREYLRYDSRLGPTLAGGAMTAAPLVILLAPVIKNFLHAARVARFMAVFYTAFIAKLVRAGLGEHTRTPFLLVLVLLALFVVPSAVKTSQNFNFDDGLSGEVQIETKNANSRLQLRTWRFAILHYSEPVHGTAQFKNMALLTRSRYRPISSPGGIAVVKNYSLRTNNLIDGLDEGKRLIKYNVSRQNTIYSNGGYLIKA